MKRLTCELCGSTDFVKQDGMFVCQACGCKYTLEEARKMMMGDEEGTPAAPAAAPAAPARADNSALIDNYLQMANTALEASNNAEAEAYANKIIELDVNNWRAWFIKGKAAGWQTTGANNRYPESIVNWINAWKNAPEEDRPELKVRIAVEADSISAAMMQMKANAFANYRSEDNSAGVTNILKMIEQQLDELKQKTGIEVYNEKFKTRLAQILNGALVQAGNASLNEFGTDNSRKTEYAWKNFTDQGDRILALYNKAYDLSTDDAIRHKISSNAAIVGENVRDSCSYSYSSYSSSYTKHYEFTAEAKKIRTEAIDKWKEKKNKHDPQRIKNNYAIAIRLLEESVKEIEEVRGRRKYWEEHSDEKAALESEKESLLNNIKELETGKRSDPLLESAAAVKEKIRTLNLQLSNLGMFKMKERKAVQEQIDAAQLELNSLNDSAEASARKYDDEIGVLRSRIHEIDGELTRSRGSLPLERGDRPVIFEAGSGSGMTPVDMLRYISDKIDAPYHLKSGTEEDIINASKSQFEVDKIVASLLSKGSSATGREWVDDPEKTKLYRINILDREDKTVVGVVCDAKTTTSPIEGLVRFIPKNDLTPSDTAEFIKIVSLLLYDFLPSSSIEDIQKVLAGAMYKITETDAVTSDGFKLKFIRTDPVTLELVRE